MQEILERIEQTALALGIEHVFPYSEKDTILLPRPRLEYEILPAKLVKTGRCLNLKRYKNRQEAKYELYLSLFDILCTFFTEDIEDLDEKMQAFILNMPQNIQDKKGNHTKVIVSEMKIMQEGEKRIGKDSIKVFSKYQGTVTLQCKTRVTEQKVFEAMDNLHIQLPNKVG